VVLLQTHLPDLQQVWVDQVVLVLLVVLVQQVEVMAVVLEQMLLAVAVAVQLAVLELFGVQIELTLLQIPQMFNGDV
jgi:hypothetical protein